jgi:hypothetical protein
MATIPINFTGEKGLLSDYQHAARLFVDDNMRLVPKNKFSFHVVFEFNTKILSQFNSIDQNRVVINKLVKKIDLPKFEITTTTANQYNRKKIIQTKIDYKPINITFHDDSEGVIRSLWENYFEYYYADYVASQDKIKNYSRDATSKFHATQTMTNSAGQQISRDFKYGLDNGSSIPFLSGITVYQLSKKKWNSFTLVNPLITSWSHDSMDYAGGSNHAEHNLTVQYEAVSYNMGELSEDNPPGFSTEYYDQVPSSLSLEPNSPPSGVLYNAVSRAINS